MIIGAYDLYLICDYPDDSWAHRGSGEFPGPGSWRHAQYAETFSEAKAQAKRGGWTFTKDRRVLCPYCKRLGRTLPPADQT